jgi:peptide/nickel transport system substrate-binding protein
MNSLLLRPQRLQIKNVFCLLLAIVMLLALRISPAATQAERSITIGLNSVLESMDVHTAIGPNVIGTRVYGLFHDTLLQTGHSGELEPVLATSYDNDGLAWRFSLREGVVFHDGTTMTADDVVYSFERLLDPANEASNFGQDLQRFVSGIEATGNMEVTITTHNLDPLLPLRVASYWASIVPAEATEAMDAGARMSAPLGAGPYKVVEFIAGDRLVLERHDAYWGGKPATGEVVLRFITEDATRIAALQAGDVDLITQVPVDQIDALRAAGGITVSSAMTNNHMAVNFNTVKGPTADVNIRRAMSLAIDRELIVQELWQGLSTVPPDYLFPGAIGHDPDYPGFAYDPEAARALVAESDYDGRPINFQATAGYYANTDVIMPVMAQMWEDIGLNINYEPMEGSAFLDLYFAGDIMTNLQQFNGAGDGQQFFQTWAIENIWRPNYYQPGAEYDELFTSIAQSVDAEERYAGLQALKTLVDADVPVAPIYRNIDIYAFSEALDWRPGPGFIMNLRPANLRLAG